MNLKDKLPYKVFVEKTNKRNFDSLNIKQNNTVEKLNNNNVNSLINKPVYNKTVEKINRKSLNKPSLFDFYPKEWHGAIRTFIIKAYKKKFKIHEISEALGVSTRTVHKVIIKWRNGKRLTMKGWRRRYPKYLRLTCVRICVKIKRIKEVQRLFMNLVDWLQNAEILDFDAIMRGKPV